MDIKELFIKELEKRELNHDVEIADYIDDSFTDILECVEEVVSKVVANEVKQRAMENKVLENLADKIEKAGCKVVFGLEAQGHIPTIEAILDDLGSCDYSWDKIAKDIGWCSKAARNHYISHLRGLGKKQLETKAPDLFQDIGNSCYCGLTHGGDCEFCGYEEE